MKPYLKWTAISVGSIVAIAHIGVLGHLIREQPEQIQDWVYNNPDNVALASKAIDLYKLETGVTQKQQP